MDRRNKKPGSAPLYIGHWSDTELSSAKVPTGAISKLLFFWENLAVPEGFEPSTLCLEGRCSIP